MTKFIYRAKKGPQEVVSGEMDAPSEDHVINQLTNQGLVPMSIIEKGKELQASDQAARSSLPNIPINAENIKFKSKAINIFTRQLASLIKAGVPILKALSLIAQQTEEPKLKRMVIDLEKQIREGKMLSASLAKYPNVFNSLYINLIKAGEKSGALGEVLNNLLEYREKEQEIQQKVQAALAYPLLTATVGVFTVFAMLTFCMPKLLGLFEGMHRKLPLSTKILIDMSNFLSANWIWFVMVFVFLFLVFSRVKEGSKKKAILDYLKLNLPVFNKFVRDAEVAKFSRTLGLLIKNGVSVYSSLEMAIDVLDNMTLKDRLKQARLEISTQGSSLSGSLKKSNTLPAFVINMVTIGEEGGRLDSVLKEVADLYEREVEHGIKIITSLLEPIFILIVGVVVGFIVIAMLLPVFDIGTSIH
jgi:type II secretory pathway component PulF